MVDNLLVRFRNRECEEDVLNRLVLLTRAIWGDGLLSITVEVTASPQVIQPCLISKHALPNWREESVAGLLSIRDFLRRRV